MNFTCLFTTRLQERTYSTRLPDKKIDEQNSLKNFSRKHRFSLLKDLRKINVKTNVFLQK